MSDQRVIVAGRQRVLTQRTHIQLTQQTDVINQLRHINAIIHLRADISYRVHHTDYIHSFNLNRLTVPHCRLSVYTVQMSAFGPTVWNSLPDELGNSDSFDGFKQFLKTILFSSY